MAKKEVRKIEDIKWLLNGAEHSIKYHTEEMTRLAMKVTPNAEIGNLKNVEDLSKRIVAEGKAITKAKKELKELKAELKEAEANEIQESENPIDKFLESWKEKAREYYTNLRAEYLQARGDRDAFKKLEKKTTKKELEIVGQMYDAEFLENILTKEVVAKKRKLIAQVEGYTGKIVDTKGLHIGVDGGINGKVIGEQDTVRIETIYAGGHSIQCLHYRVLIKSVNN